ncbi:hypothetical protein [Bacillus sp. AFS023182]|nr:hypothetical protein [Bacillus sp. AFS023182]
MVKNQSWFIHLQNLQFIKPHIFLRNTHTMITLISNDGLAPNGR